MAGSGTCRLFLAVELSAEIRRIVAGLQQELRKAGLFRGGFPRPENLHLTLEFLGATPVDLILPLITELKTVRFRPFPLRLTDLGTFGGRRPRVVWVGLEGAGLASLQRNVAQAVARVTSGSGNAAREYRPHLTLARIKQVACGARLQEKLSRFRVPAAGMEVDGFSLMRSELNPQGASYTRLQAFAADEN